MPQRPRNRQHNERPNHRRVLRARSRLCQVTFQNRQHLVVEFALNVRNHVSTSWLFNNHHLDNLFHFGLFLLAVTQLQHLLESVPYGIAFPVVQLVVMRQRHVLVHDVGHLFEVEAVEHSADALGHYLLLSGDVLVGVSVRAGERGLPRKSSQLEQEAFEQLEVLGPLESLGERLVHVERLLQRLALLFFVVSDGVAPVQLLGSLAVHYVVD